MTHKLTISIVTYNNEATIAQTLDSIEHSTLTPGAVIVVDNSSRSDTADLISARFPAVTLIPSENIGFGAGHNKAIRQVEGISAYHLVMNPDVYFGEEVLERLVAFMDEHPAVGLVMPRILYPDESVQHLCKLLPTPFDLIGRRFIPGFLKPLFGKRLRRYEMRHKDYNRMMGVPHLSGCFMLLRTGVFREVGGFDERFFMYLEDVDFSRRIHARFKTVYFPEVPVYHQYHKGSYKRWKHLKHHVVSAVKYFNKWGWFFDKERKAVNRAAG
jgi:GT2 family glycosyltransferase